MKRRQAARLARGIVDAEVEEEAAAGGDGEARRQRETLQLYSEWAQGVRGQSECAG